MPVATVWSGRETQVGLRSLVPSTDSVVLAASGDSPIPTGLEPPRTVSLPSSANTYQLTGLQPGTEYRITLYTLYDGREVATPVTTFQTGDKHCGALKHAPLSQAIETE